MVIGVIYEFLLVWPFVVRKKGQGHWRIFESSNLLFQRVTKIVKPVNPKKKVPDVWYITYAKTFFQLNSANIIIKTYEILQLKYIQSQIIGFLLINL